MSMREPVIKFSPFEALLIGEKNKVLKRQPMKNTIFVTRLNQKSKPINLKELFDLEKVSKGQGNDVIFKMPQRVSDFLKHRRLQSSRSKTPNKKNKEILCYEYEGCKMITRNNKILLPSDKNIKTKSNKVKFKRKFKYKDTINSKVVKKFPNPPANRRCQRHKFKSFPIKNENVKISTKNKHLLRGKDGKFISKNQYKENKSEKISPKQKFLSNYLHRLYLKKNNELCNINNNNSQLNSSNKFSDFEMPYSVKAIVGLPNLQFDITASEKILDEISKKYYEKNCNEDFQFPKYPEQLEPLDFEKDSNLNDIIYENFPKSFKFRSQNDDYQFIDSLIDSDILKPERNLKIYEKNTNGFVNDGSLKNLLPTRFPLIRLKRINDILPNLYPMKNDKSLLPSKIDEPHHKKTHLITEKTFTSFFFKSSEGKDVFIGNLMKPFFQNSWFGSLPES